MARWTTPDGREHSRAFETRDAAEAHLSRVDVLARAGEWVRDRATTMADWSAPWSARQVHHRPGTRAQVEAHLRLYVLPALGPRRVADLTRADVADLVAGWTHAPATQRVTWSYLSALLREARREHLTDIDLADRIRLPAVEARRVVPMSVEAVERLAAAMVAPLAGAVWFAAGTGLRPGEWRGLTLDRLRLDAAVLRVVVDRQLVGVAGGRPVWGPPNTAASGRRVTLAAVTAERLREHLAAHPSRGHGLVFGRARTGLPLGRSDISGPWQTAAARAGLTLPERSRWHELRHHHASLLIAAGLSPGAVADRLGHADVSETMATYAHLWHDDDERSRSALQEAYGGGPSRR